MALPRSAACLKVRMIEKPATKPWEGFSPAVAMQPSRGLQGAPGLGGGEHQSPKYSGALAMPPSPWMRKYRWTRCLSMASQCSLAGSRSPPFQSCQRYSRKAAVHVGSPGRKPNFWYGTTSGSEPSTAISSTMVSTKAAARSSKWKCRNMDSAERLASPIQPRRSSRWGQSVTTPPMMFARWLPTAPRCICWKTSSVKLAVALGSTALLMTSLWKVRSEKLSLLS
mmetsp:Transcript_73903/g.229937  ORF Transcript_73903/g.229937 Transcript_73903/m.229937 type:complete len:225 (-) Transcript_73903:143-817(-)